MNEQMCERCRSVFDSWRVFRAELRVGRIHSLPMLCRDCSRGVEGAVLMALFHPAAQVMDQPQSVAAVDPQAGSTGTLTTREKGSA